MEQWLDGTWPLKTTTNKVKGGRGLRSKERPPQSIEAGCSRARGATSSRRPAGCSSELPKGFARYIAGGVASRSGVLGTNASVARYGTSAWFTESTRCSITHAKQRSLRHISFRRTSTSEGRRCNKVVYEIKERHLRFRRMHQKSEALKPRRHV